MKQAETVAESGDAQHLRMLEALLFAATEPLDEASLSARLPEEAAVPALLEELNEAYRFRGVNLVKVAGKWAFRTAPDLHFLLQEHRQETRRLSRAALETLAIVAYHQPVTRAEIEDIRGVAISRGTLDMLLEVRWIRMRGRRRTPGRPVTYGTTDVFLEHFGLETTRDLPGLDDLRATGLLEGEVPTGLLTVTENLPEDPLADDDDLAELAETEAGARATAPAENPASADIVPLNPPTDDDN